MKNYGYCVLIGNPIDGLIVTGPFLTQDVALEWAEENGGDEWWVAELEEPA